MNYQASIHELRTGRFMMRCSVDARSPLEAEQVAINKAVLILKGRPHELDVRHLQQRSLQGQAGGER